MVHLVPFAVLSAFCQTAVSAANFTRPDAVYLDSSYSLKERAQDLLQLMTWDEKIGQMGGVRRLFDSSLVFNRTSYDQIHAHQNGILGFGANLNYASDVLPIANSIRAEQINSTRLGIPYITVCDSVNGILLVGGTLFPGSLSMGSSWNLPLYEQVVAAIRDENMAMGVYWVLSPELDIAKEPRNGRVGEMYGEDAYLVGEFGTKYVKTMQEKDQDGYVKVATTIKHFVYGLPSGGINTASQGGGLNHIFNDLAPPFIRAIKEASPLSLMASYASIDRVPMSANKYMLQTVLRDKMGFKGLIMSDALAIIHLLTQSRVAESQADAALLALRAGLQLELSPSQPALFPTLLAASNDTQVAQLVDEAVLQILEIKFATGTFDRRLPSLETLESTLRAERHLDINRNMSREAVVLLQNDGLLPLKRHEGRKVAVLGPFADIINAGSYAANNASSPVFGNTLRTSLISQFGAENIRYIQGVDFVDLSPDSRIDAAVAAAKEAGLAVLMLGSLAVSVEDPLTPKRTDGEFYSHADLGFPGLQQQLLDAVLDAGVPTILVLSGGQAFVLNNSTLRANAILHSFVASEYTADSVVEILLGMVNPSGKLTISLPQASGAIPINYDYLPSDAQGGRMGGLAWQFPVLQRDPPMKFGFGLSYTTFDISAPSVEFEHAAVGEKSVKMTAMVSNTGEYAGKEVVQLYFRQQFSRIEVPVKKLIRFSKIELAPGESRNVTFTIPQTELGYYLDTEWCVDGGDYTFFIGPSSRDVDLKAVNVTISV